jgi:hypothetical protein
MAYVGKKPADTALTANDLATGIVSADKLATNAVTTVKVNADAITNAKTEFTPGLVIKGDGSSADGKLTLNCSQNTHGVSIQGPPHSAGQSYTLTLPQSITSGYFLKTDGSGNLSFAQATETKPTVADVSQTIAPDTATSFNITGTNFSGIPKVEFIKTTGAVTVANSVSLTNSTTLAVNATLASGTYYVRIELDDGNAARSTNAIITASYIFLCCCSYTETTSVLTANTDTPASTMNLTLSGNRWRIITIMAYTNYIHRTPSSNGNRQKFTISTWVKKTNATGQGWIITVDTYSSGNMAQLQLDTGSYIGFQQYHGSSNQTSVTTNNLLRDVNAWYHLVLRVDTTQSTAADRVRIYINGTEASYDTTTYPSQNFEYQINHTTKHSIGSREDTSSGSSLYYSHYHLCDGYSYAPTEFGETDSTTGEWKIKTSPSVSYGTNGFFIFKDGMNLSGSTVQDQSGQSHNLTLVGTSVETQDNPSNSFCYIKCFSKTVYCTNDFYS